MKVIVGLGNPGKKYEWTRHNAGFLAIDEILRQTGKNVSLKLIKGSFQAVRISDKREKIVLSKPTLYMNESGWAVQAALKEYDVLPADCLVLVDDVNIPLGTIRFRANGSAGGHHGLESIINILETSAFPRLRIGVGQPGLNGRDLTDYVLGSFSGEEREVLVPQLQKASKACLEWVHSGSEAAMRSYN